MIDNPDPFEFANEEYGGSDKIDWPNMPTGDPAAQALWHADRGAQWLAMAEHAYATSLAGTPHIRTVTDPCVSLAQAHAAVSGAWSAIAARDTEDAQ